MFTLNVCLVHVFSSLNCVQILWTYAKHSSKRLSASVEQNFEQNFSTFAKIANNEMPLNAPKHISLNMHKMHGKCYVSLRSYLVMAVVSTILKAL